MFSSSPSIPFNPATDIPNLSGKVVLITGASNGIGAQTALDLAKHNPSQLWLAARSRDKTNAVIDQIKARSPSFSGSIRFLELDLASFDSIKAAARQVTASSTRLDILILNAGIMGGPPATTTEGYEIGFGVNHVGHALLLKLLTPLLLAASSNPVGDGGGIDPRVVSVSSKGHKFCAPVGIEFDTLKSPQEHVPTIIRYCQSKLANVLYAQEAARRFEADKKRVTVVVLNPGDVRTTELYGKGHLGLKMNVLSAILLPLIGTGVEQGAKNQLWAATAPDGVVVAGEYYDPVGIKGGQSELSKDTALAKRLWEWTQKELQGQEI